MPASGRLHTRAAVCYPPPMNEHVRQIGPPLLPATTQAAEGLPRRKWTLAEIEQLSEQGVFGGVDRERERFELIGGEIVPMSAKGAFHEDVKRALNRFWVKALPPELEALTETTLRDAPHDFREPDFIFWPATVSVRDLKPANVQLLVEISDSSLGYDLGPKAAYYASLGLPNYWVIDAKRLVTHIHRQPADGAYTSVTHYAYTDQLVPLALPSLAECLADLGLPPSA